MQCFPFSKHYASHLKQNVLKFKRFHKLSNTTVGLALSLIDSSETKPESYTKCNTSLLTVVSSVILQREFWVMLILSLLPALRPPVPPPFTQAFSRIVWLLCCDVFVHVLRRVLQRAVEERSALWTEAMIQRVC